MCNLKRIRFIVVESVVEGKRSDYRLEVLLQRMRQYCINYLPQPSRYTQFKEKIMLV